MHRYRSTLPQRLTTILEHRPKHRCYRDWTRERIRAQAAKVRPDADMIDVILGRDHVRNKASARPSAFLSQAGEFLPLPVDPNRVARYGQERVDAACAPCPSPVRQSCSPSAS